MTFCLILFFWIVSLSLHEYAHALCAYRGGDYTVKGRGYLTFNPLLYMNSLMSFIIPMAALIMGGIALPGGAVLIRPDLLRSRAWRSYVSLAGPLANLAVLLLMAVPIWLHLEYLYPHRAFWAGYTFFAWLQLTVTLLNLLPIPPLDGWGIIEPYLPRSIQEGARSFGLWSLILLFMVLQSPKGGQFFLLGLQGFQWLGFDCRLISEGWKAFQPWR